MINQALGLSNNTDLESLNFLKEITTPANCEKKKAEIVLKKQQLTQHLDTLSSQVQALDKEVADLKSKRIVVRNKQDLFQHAGEKDSAFTKAVVRWETVAETVMVIGAAIGFFGIGTLVAGAIFQMPPVLWVGLGIKGVGGIMAFAGAVMHDSSKEMILEDQVKNNKAFARFIKERGLICTSVSLGEKIFDLFQSRQVLLTWAAQSRDKMEALNKELKDLQPA